ncbi:MAG: hypothetical protein J6T24_00515, partial [Clostridia bacterium]|nr:hypothetical protein [Clostridia bacterium]
MKARSFVALLLVILMVLPLFTACGGNGDGTTAGTTAPVTTAPDAPGPIPPEGDPSLSLKVIEGLSEYTIVYPDAATDEVLAAAAALRDAIAEKTGVTLPLASDRVAVGTAVPTDTKEILLGLTNRAESRASSSLRYYDFYVAFENGRLALQAAGDEALISAMEFAAESLLSADGLFYADGGYHYAMQYPVADLTIFGTPVSEYTIVRDKDNAPIAYYLRDRICNLTGYYLPIRTVEETETAHEILIGDTGRAATSAPLDGNFYVVDGVGTKVALYGTGEYAAIRAVMAFATEYLMGTVTDVVPTRTAVENDEILLFSLNLPEGILSAAGQYDVNMTTDAVLARFHLAKDAMPDEVTVLSRVDLALYPLSERVQVYVSPTGDDDNPGTKDAPFATLRRAATAMEFRGGGVIWMMEGSYRIDTPVLFNSKHSGTAMSPLFIKAYEDADVTLTANTNISTDLDLWHYVDPADNVGIYERLPEATRDEVMYTVLAEHGLTSEDFADITKASGPPRLYVGEEEYTLARYPNDTGDIKDLLYFEYVYDTGTVTSTSCLLYWPWIERATKAGMDPKTWIVGWETRIPTGDARGQEI